MDTRRLTDAGERDDWFLCYHCKEGDCENCVGVPCMCSCPDPMKFKPFAEEQLEELGL